MASVSSTVRSVNTRGSSERRAGGITAFAPGESRRLVVFFRIRLPRFEIFDRHRLLCAVNGNRLAAHAHVHPVAREKGLRRLKRKLLRVLDLAAHIIGQSAVRVGNIPRAFEHDDLRTLVQTADTRRCRGAARDAADNDHFHNASPFWFFLPSFLPITSK